MLLRTSPSVTRRNPRTCLPGVAQLAEPAEVPRPRGHDVADPLRAAGDERVQHLGDVEDDRLDHGPRHAERPVAGQHDAEPVARLQAAALVVAHAGGELVAVPHPRVGGHDHPGAGHLRPPAQAHVVEEVADALVEAADLGEQVGAHERARRRAR